MRFWKKTLIWLERADIQDDSSCLLMELSARIWGWFVETNLQMQCNPSIPFPIRQLFSGKFQRSGCSSFSLVFMGPCCCFWKFKRSITKHEGKKKQLKSMKNLWYQVIQAVPKNHPQTLGGHQQPLEFRVTLKSSIPKKVKASGPKLSHENDWWFQSFPWISIDFMLQKFSKS